MRRKPNLPKNPGVAAMLVVTAFALLFIALVVGLSVVSLREQKQAGDTDQSNRAVMLAESGIADAFSTLENNPAYREPNCTKRLDSSDNGWSCRTITTTPGEPEGSLGRDESDIIRADKAELENPDGSKTPVRYATSLTVNYCNDQDKCSLSPNPFSIANPYPVYPPSVETPAVVELSFVYWKAHSTNLDPTAGDNQINSAEDVKVKTVVIDPGDPSMDDQSPLPGTKLQSKCSATANTDGYFCTIDNIDIGALLGGPAEQFRTVVKIKARYSDSHYKMTFKNTHSAGFGLPEVVPVPATDFTVDVTGKSGNVYRRIVARRKIEQTVSQGVFDNALFATGNICKNMTVKNDLSLSSANTCE